MATCKHKPLRIVVIGAGVAGCLVVYGLQDEPDVEVICIEKGPPINEMAGTGLNIGPNSLKILKQFSPGLAAALSAEGVSLPWQSWKAGLTDGTVIMDLPLSQVADNPGIRLRWSALYECLRNTIAGNVRYQTTVVAMAYTESDATGPLSLVIENQVTGERETLEQVDLILGCDGRYSQVRQTFLPEPVQAKHLGVCIYRLLVPNTRDRLIRDYQQWFHNGSRLLAFEIPGNEVYIAGSFPLATDLSIPEEAKTAAFLQTCYKPPNGYSDVCKFLVKSVCDNLDTIHWARIQEIPTAFGDRRGHVLCLGDSSHAMFPTLGQGASQAFEDGCLFAARASQAIAEARRQRCPVNIPALVWQIEQDRRERIEFVQTFSRQASDSLLAGSNPAIELRQKTEAPFLKKLERLYRDTPSLLKPYAMPQQKHDS